MRYCAASKLEILTTVVAAVSCCTARSLAIIQAGALAVIAFCMQGCAVLHSWHTYGLLCGAHTLPLLPHTCCMISICCLDIARSLPTLQKCVLAASTATACSCLRQPDVSKLCMLAAHLMKRLRLGFFFRNSCLLVDTSAGVGVNQLVFVYFLQGLLAGRDDFELMKKGSIRDINRHFYSVEEAKAALQRPVVQVSVTGRDSRTGSSHLSCLAANTFRPRTLGQLP